MGRFFDFESPIMQYLQKIATVIFCGFFWLLLLLPVITAGAATTAMYTEMFHLREEKNAGVGDFFKVFAKEFGKSTVLWILDLIALALVLAFFYFLSSFESEGIFQLILMLLAVIPLLCYLFTFSYVFPLTAYFENSILNTVKNAFIMSIGFLKQTIPVLALISFPITLAIVCANLSYDLYYYVFIYPLPIWIFVILPLIIYWQTYFFLNVFREYITDETPSA